MYNLLLASVAVSPPSGGFGDFSFLGDLVAPALVAVLAFLGAYQYSDWNNRIRYSKLGVAIIDELLTEVRLGHDILRGNLAVANDPDADRPLGSQLPVIAWDGMQTIPNEVLLRIVACASYRPYRAFPPVELRTHLKNYYGHMCPNFDNLVNELRGEAVPGGVMWKVHLRNALEPSKEGGWRYIEAAQNVIHTLEDARELLQKNADAWPPQ